MPLIKRSYEKQENSLDGKNLYVGNYMGKIWIKILFVMAII